MLKGINHFIASKAAVTTLYDIGGTIISSLHQCLDSPLRQTVVGIYEGNIASLYVRERSITGTREATVILMNNNDIGMRGIALQNGRGIISRAIINNSHNISVTSLLSQH